MVLVPALPGTTYNRFTVASYIIHYKVLVPVLDTVVEPDLPPREYGRCTEMTLCQLAQW
jgi:hypothetical protein